MTPLPYSQVLPQVPVLWDQGPRIALIGEAPGRDEVSTGQVFQGAAGRELNQWIQAVGLFRSQLYIGNLSRCQPPGNDLSQWFVDSHCTVPNQQLQEDIDLLLYDLALLQPNVIVTLGRLPMHVLAGTQGIFKWWGSILECQQLPGTKLIPLPHPAFVIRGMYRMRPLCVTFLERAKRESLTRGIPQDTKERILFPNVEQVLYHLERLSQLDAFTLDIEDPPPFPGLTCIGFADSPDWSLCIPFVKGGQPYWTVGEEVAVTRAIDKLLRSDATKIVHNLIYDFTKLSRLGFYIAPPYWDTMKGHNRLYPDLSNKTMKKFKMNSLGNCAAIYCKQPRFWKDDFKVDNTSGPKFTGGTEQSFFKYNCDDNLNTYEIYQEEVKELSKLGLLDLVKHDMSCFTSTAYMSLRGVKRDLVLLNKLKNAVDRVLIKNAAKVRAMADMPNLNLASPKQIAELLYTKRKLPPIYNTNKATGKKSLSTDETALLKNKNSDPIIPYLLFDRRIAKLQTTYLNSEISSDGRTRTTYNDGRTSTFRLSSSESILGGGLNLQTIPSRPRPGEDFYNKLIKLFKRTFIPDPGNLFWKRDYKQAEAVYVAYDSEDIPLIEDFLNKIDVHCRTASYITGEDYAKIYSEYKNGNPEYKFKRRFAKPVKHGVNYKMSWVKLQELFLLEGLVASAQDCKRAIEAVLSASPFTQQWHYRIEDQLKRTGYVTNGFGHIYRFFGRIDDDAVREGLAFGPQSTIGLMTQYAAKRVYDEIQTCQDSFSQAELLLNIHDALMGQSPKDEVLSHGRKVQELMTIPLMIHGREMVIESDLAIGPSWGEMKEVD